MTATCTLAGSVPEGLPGSRLAARHRAACLRCQADQVRQRALLRDLAALRDELLVAPVAVHQRVMARIGPQDSSPAPSRILRRWIGGGLAAAAIGAAALFGGMARRRARAAG